MRLNTIQPAAGSKHAPKRVGRGESAGQGKTCGRGQKGQHSRSGGFHKVGFEGGQMPLQRRLPKYGFASRKARFVAELRLQELEAAAVIAGDEPVTLEVLKRANLVTKNILRVKVIASGEIGKAVKTKGLGATKGARAAIEAAGGSLED